MFDINDYSADEMTLFAGSMVAAGNNEATISGEEAQWIRALMSNPIEAMEAYTGEAMEPGLFINEISFCLMGRYNLRERAEVVSEVTFYRHYWDTDYQGWLSVVGAAAKFYDSDDLQDGWLTWFGWDMYYSGGMEPVEAFHTATEYRYLH